MANGVYDRQIATAQRLIKKYGQLVKWRILQNTPAANAWEADVQTVTEKDVYIVFLPDTREGRETYRAITGEVPAGQVQALMGQVDFTPDLKDVIIRDGKTLTMNYIDVLSPNGEVILYTIGFQK